MLFSQPNPELICRNPDCPKPRFPAEQAMFLCPSPSCPGGPGQLDGGAVWPGRVLFRPRRFSYSVQCPYSPHLAYEKVCPSCMTRLPPYAGNTAAVSVVGASVSGKTCFVTALLRHIRVELSKRSSYEMSIEWDDQAGLDYFKQQERAIFTDGFLPESTQKEAALASMQVTVRFPVRRFWSKLWHGSQGTLSLFIPDPSGEFFQNQDEVRRLEYLATARAIILMVDPFMSYKYREKLKAQGREGPPYEAGSPAEALGGLISVLRGSAGRPTGKLDTDLAVVLTKCDEPGVFDPDNPQWEGRWPVQGRNYDPARAAAMSAAIEQFIEEEFDFAELVALARQTFGNVSYFAASALGRPPIRSTAGGDVSVRLSSPQPRRVEEPLLWILHRWGYI